MDRDFCTQLFCVDNVKTFIFRAQTLEIPKFLFYSIIIYHINKFRQFKWIFELKVRTDDVCSSLNCVVLTFSVFLLGSGSSRISRFNM